VIDGVTKYNAQIRHSVRLVPGKLTEATAPLLSAAFRRPVLEKCINGERLGSYRKVAGYYVWKPSTGQTYKRAVLKRCRELLVIGRENGRPKLPKEA